MSRPRTEPAPTTPPPITAADLITAIASATPEELIKLSRLIKFAETVPGTPMDGPVVQMTVVNDSKAGQPVSFAVIKRTDLQAGFTKRNLARGEIVSVNLGTGDVG